MIAQSARTHRSPNRKEGPKATATAVKGLLRCNEDMNATIGDQRISDRMETEAFTEFITCRLAHEARLKSSLVAKYLHARETRLLKSQKVKRNDLEKYRILRFQRFKEYEEEWKDKPDTVEDFGQWLALAGSRVYGRNPKPDEERSHFVTLVLLSIRRIKSELSDLMRLPGLTGMANRRLSTDWKRFVRRLGFRPPKKKHVH
jgi:hypothetical protein